MSQPFNVKIWSGEDVIDIHDDNVDVEITLENGEVYSAAFFTLLNLKTLMTRYRESGECAHGLYVWSVDMVIVDLLTEETIMNAVGDLVSTGQIYSACSRIR